MPGRTPDLASLRHVLAQGEKGGPLSPFVILGRSKERSDAAQTLGSMPWQSWSGQGAELAACFFLRLRP